MAKAKEPITKGMLIGDIIKKHPFSIEIMLEHGMQCVGCHVATWETLEQAAYTAKKDFLILIFPALLTGSLPAAQLNALVKDGKSCGEKSTTANYQMLFMPEVKNETGNYLPKRKMF